MTHNLSGYQASTKELIKKAVPITDKGTISDYTVPLRCPGGEHTERGAVTEQAPEFYFKGGGGG